MCLAIPGKILTIDQSTPQLRMAKVDFGGICKNICIEWLDVNEGDYVLAHAGVALSKVDQQAALETLQAFQQIVDVLDKESKIEYHE